MAENLVREAFMRRRVETVIAEGNKPEKIVAIVGAFHAPVLSSEFPAMTDDELKRLPRRSSKLTLMPYSYFKLSTQSGYGAAIWHRPTSSYCGKPSRKEISTSSQPVISHWSPA